MAAADAVKFSQASATPPHATSQVSRASTQRSHRPRAAARSTFGGTALTGLRIVLTVPPDAAASLLRRARTRRPGSSVPTRLDRVTFAPGLVRLAARPRSSGAPGTPGESANRTAREPDWTGTNVAMTGILNGADHARLRHCEP